MHYRLEIITFYLLIQIYQIKLIYPFYSASAMKGDKFQMGVISIDTMEDFADK